MANPKWTGLWACWLWTCWYEYVSCDAHGWYNQCDVKITFLPKKSQLFVVILFKMSKHEIIYISSAIFYIISLFHETLSVFHYSSLSLKISKKCLCWGTIGMYLSNGAEYGYVVIMMKLNMYVMSMLTFRRSKIGENWKLQHWTWW